MIGELNIDMIATGLTEAPQMGGEILATDFQLALGSASAIFACGVAKLGHPVTFISQVGDDYFGKYCLAALRAAGVSTKNVSVEAKLKTGVSVALSTRRDRALVTHPGAIATLRYEQLRLSRLRGQSHLHMTSYFLQHALRPSFAQIFRQVRRLGLTTSFDPNSDPARLWGDEIKEVLEQTDVLFLNESEALQITRTRRVRSALKLLGRTVPCVVIKLGPKGSIAIKDDEIVSARGFKVEALDTTGAGDSFAAGFVSAYLAGAPLTRCLQVGNACGALSTLKAGGTNGQPDIQGLKKFMRAQGAAART
ncbi:MAG: carbohydrate kinase family protein [Pyrinomonadaceae bacterium]